MSSLEEIWAWVIFDRAHGIFSKPQHQRNLWSILQELFKRHGLSLWFSSKNVRRTSCYTTQLYNLLACEQSVPADKMHIDKYFRCSFCHRKMLSLDSTNLPSLQDRMSNGLGKKKRFLQDKILLGPNGSW